MNRTLLASLGCIVLLAATLAPATLAHEENSRNPWSADWNGVSGQFVGSAGAVLLDGSSSYPSAIAHAPLLCDFEVAGDGTIEFPQDEVTVDGSSGGSVSNFFDDGGQGGACHTNHYAHNAYNTPGCPVATAHADNGQATGPFIAAACDWKTVEGGTPQSDIFALCSVNSFLSGQVLNIVDCLLSFLNCVLNPTGDCTTDGTEACGSDGVSDGMNYGHGLAGVYFPTGSADKGDIAHQLDFGVCYWADATAQVLVFDEVATNTPLLEIHVRPALTGEIWQDGSSTGFPCITLYCYTDCPTGQMGVQVGSTNVCQSSLGVPGTPTGVKSCAVYNSVYAPAPYPGQDGIVVEFDPPGQAGDVALCAGTVSGSPCAAGQPGVQVNNGLTCVPPLPTLCNPSPSPGWAVGVGGTCVGLPWAVIGAASPCPGSATVNLRIHWGTTPGFTPGSTFDVCL